MRYLILVFVFVVFSFSANASWQSFQGDLGNTGASNEVGYFPLKTSNFSSDYGMGFQPLVGNLDNKGANEIIIFVNQSLIIFDPQLNILSQVKVGDLLGQPTLFEYNNSVRIIFNSRQNADYFFVYHYESALVQDFNITLNNEANFSGIKCLVKVLNAVNGSSQIINAFPFGQSTSLLMMMVVAALFNALS